MMPRYASVVTVVAMTTSHRQSLKKKQLARNVYIIYYFITQNVESATYTSNSCIGCVLAKPDQ